MTQSVFYHPPIDNCSLITAPLAYLHLGAALKGSRHNMELLDGRITENPIDILIGMLEGKDALLVTAMPGSQIKTALKACKAVHEHYPHMPIIWGGSHASLDPIGTLRSPYVTCVIAGRGEIIIADVLDRLHNPNELNKLPNVFVKSSSGEVLSKKYEAPDLKEPLIPDYSILPSLEPYIMQTRQSARMIDYISSFGCPFPCGFCCEPVISGSKWSSIAPERLVQHIRLLQAEYSIDGILFQDANFVADFRRLVRFCELLLETGTTINWISTARISDIQRFEQKGYLSLMRKSGCEMLFMGAEAGSEATINSYNKGIHVMDTLGAAKLLWNKYGIFPHFSYVISYPVEEMSSVEATLNLHLQVCDIVGAPSGEIGYYNPTPGTAFLKEHEHYFAIPDSLEGWASFDFLKQNLYKNPSPALSKLLLKHYLNIYKKYPHIKSHMTFDIWQNKSIS